MMHERWFCLLRGDAGPMAVPAESVAEVLDIDRMVRLAWSPPQVAGLCPYRREVIPVVRLASSPRDAAMGSPAEPNPPTEIHPSGEGQDVDDHARCILLILKAGRVAWGIRSDPVWTSMSRESPEYHPPRTDSDGPVLVGTILHEGTRYGVLDTEATWQVLRSAIGRWYGFIGEPEMVTSIAPGEGQPESLQESREGTGEFECRRGGK
jgi:chemotaxis signal transduction protein